jgi:hypothetical protein
LVKINIETNDEKLFSFAEEFFAKGEQFRKEGLILFNEAVELKKIFSSIIEK